MHSASKSGLLQKTLVPDRTRGHRTIGVVQLMSAVVIDRKTPLEITRHVRRMKSGTPKAMRSNATLRQSNATLKCEYAATATATRAEDSAILSKVSSYFLFV